jgi:hypothetical protein
MSLYKLLHHHNNYTVKNDKLLLPTDWCFEKETKEAFLHDYNVFQNLDYLSHEGIITSHKELHEKLILRHLIKSHGHEIYSIPIFNNEFIEMVLDEINHLKETDWFHPAPGDPNPISEFNLQHHCSLWYITQMAWVYKRFNLIFEYLFGQKVESGTVQLANYNPQEISKTGYHHDVQSAITMVVPLNTGDYEGGGTDFLFRGNIPPLPNGHGLIFPAFTHLHRGEEVSHGDRYLLVYWLGSSIVGDLPDDPVYEAQVMSQVMPQVPGKSI